MCLLAPFFLTGCVPNSPYRSEDALKNTFYTTFNEPPKHLDPARSYSSNEYDIIGQIYEPPLEYHYLKRPYELAPLVAEGVPLPVYLNRYGKTLPPDARPQDVFRAIYEIKIKKGILYQPHPAFAKDASGNFLYHNLKEKDLKGITEIKDFPATGERELTSDDFIYQIMRLGDPLSHSPILAILEKYILGLDEFAEGLKKDLENIRDERKRLAGARYSQMTDETTNPIMLDYAKRRLKGVERIDRYTFRIILKTKYPQFVYWLAMPFFSPMPEDAVRFYKQGPLEDRNITLDRFPVGTGPFRIEVYRPEMEIALVKNENYREESYPSQGETGDKENGLLEDSGKRLPFLSRIVFKLEKEDIPEWNKFLQGYFDISGITSDSFDQAISMSEERGAELTDFIKKKELKLFTTVRPSTYYMGFNMLDDTVGGYAEKNKKLRQAISIALDYEEYIEIFANGRGIPAMGPVPPGIFGYMENKDGINPFVYDWDSVKERPVRKSIDEAKRLLKEAGYPGGRDLEGSPLVITFDNPWTGVDALSLINWFAKRLGLLGIRLENRTTDYNRFQEKMLKGNFQFFSWGWNADYPDPENFLFLLAGGNGKVKYQGENAANYSSAEFDRLFKLMENMDNTPERLEVIKNMTRISQEDSPWVWGFHPVTFTLLHDWVGNFKPNAMANNAIKYRKIDVEKRMVLRKEWNRPLVWPIALVIISIAAAGTVLVMSAKKGFR